MQTLIKEYVMFKLIETVQTGLHEQTKIYVVRVIPKTI